MTAIATGTLRRFFKFWIITFATAVSLVGGLAALFPIKITFVSSVTSVAACAAVAAGAAWLQVREGHLPVEDIAPERVHGATLRLCCQCDAAIAHEANRLAARFYRREAIAFDRYEQWRLKNPTILVCLLNAPGDVLGYFDVLPLRSNFFDAFIAGKVTEKQITHEEILAASVGKRATRVYLSGIAVRNPDTFIGRRNASILLWGLLRYFEHYYPAKRNRQLYALGSTPQGEALLRRFNFQIISPASVRTDGHNLYMTPLSVLSSDAILSVPKWSNVGYSWTKKSHLLHTD